MKDFKLFFKFSVLKPNMLKCEIAGIGSLKGVNPIRVRDRAMGLVVF